MRSNLLNDPRKFRQAWRRHDDVIPPAVHVLGDSQEPSPRILPKREDKRLALNLKPLGSERVFLHMRPMPS